MTVQSIKEDIQKACPPKETSKKFDWSTFIMNSAYEQVFSSLFETYNFDGLLEDYKQQLGIYSEVISDSTE